MLTTSVLSLALLAFGPTTAPSTSKTLPPDWPPLPDFTTPVDYVKWVQDRMNRNTSAEAGRLAGDLFVQSNDPDAVRQAKNRAFGMQEDGSFPGLLTGVQLTPHRYMWNPKDHPDWEKAFQANDALRFRLLACCRGKRASVEPSWEWPKPDGNTPDFGFTPDDRVLLATLLPYRGQPRLAARILLQDAWRAPEGKIDCDRLVEAITSTLEAARSTEESCAFLIDLLVAVALRSLAYESAIHALNEGVFDAAHIEQLDHWLATNDSTNAMKWDPALSDFTITIDALQYLYISPAADRHGRLRADPARAHKVAKYLAACQDASTAPHLDPRRIESEIARCDPIAALRQAVDFYLANRDICRHKLPQDAEAATERLAREFKSDPSNHVVLRQLASGYIGRNLVLVAKGETLRRATQVIYALHIAHARTGTWPARLGDLRTLPRLVRTDPFSGKEFIYRVENGSPILYSVAMNGKDDGGKHDPRWGQGFSGKDNDTPIITDRDYVFWPVQPDH